MARHPQDDETDPSRGPVDDVPFDDPAPGWDRYAIIEFIGEGGMGVVYRAIDRRLERTVAVKFHRSCDPAEVARFQREARAQASIDHEHVCRVFEVGEVDGRGFLAMQFIDGETLRTPATDLDLEEKLDVMEQVARAVQAAHAGGVVHRDLKPGNIMVERRHDGRLHAYVLDFGIAHDSDASDEDAPTVPTGTAAFMAPERIRSDGRPADHRVDVYGLGATLYAVLAEQAPFFGATRTETKEKVLKEDPLRLGLVVPGMSEDLETIVAVAMDKDPTRRYPSARAFADDLRSWLEGRPIRTRRAGPLYRLKTWMRTRQLAAASLVLVLLVAGAAVGSALWLRYRESQRRALVTRHQNEVEQIDRVLRRARMMPLHDTTAAEDVARERLAEVEASLLATGTLARGPAHYALGFGHLMLREFREAEVWLQAAVDGGFDRPEVSSALGIAQAMQILAARRLEYSAVDENGTRADGAVRHLENRGPQTAERDDFNEALALFVAGRLDEALVLARESSVRVPWLYEALQLEGDILVVRSEARERGGDLEAAAADLRDAGEAYARAIGVARSDAWLYEAEATRLLRLIEFRPREVADLSDLVDQAVEAATAARTARPQRARPLVLASRAYLLKAEILEQRGGDPEFELVEAQRLARDAMNLDPENTVNAELQARTKALLSESRGADTG
jgi:eukaryotic-like serine/threonine-protein kinase